MNRSVSFVMPVWNRPQEVSLAIESFLEHTPQPFELWIVDNGSNAETKAVLNKSASVSSVKILTNFQNLGFPKAVNQGIQASTQNILGILNSDLVFTKNWFPKLLDGLEQAPNAGLIGPMTNAVRPSVQWDENAKYSTLPEMHRYALEKSPPPEFIPALSLTGFCMLFKKTVVETIDFFDESFGIGNFEDNDFCFRATQAGFKCYVARHCFVHHFGSKSFESLPLDYRQLIETNKKRYLEKSLLKKTELRSAWHAELGMKHAELLDYDNALAHFQRMALNEDGVFSLLDYTPELSREEILKTKAPLETAIRLTQKAAEQDPAFAHLLLGFWVHFQRKKETSKILEITKAMLRTNRALGEWLRHKEML